MEHLSRYPSSNGGPTGERTLISLRDRALLLVGWTGTLRRSEIVGLTTSGVEFVEGEGVNIYIRRSKSDQEAEDLVKDLPYGFNKETCPVTALRQWLQAAERNVEGPFEGAALLPRRVDRRERDDGPVRLYRPKTARRERWARPGGLLCPLPTGGFHHTGDPGR